MPTYEYRCSACGHAFEKFQRMNDDPVRECPECGEESAERIISSGAGLIFKGSGFYVTDYKRSSGGSEDAGGDAGSPSEGGSSADAASSADGAADGGGGAAASATGGGSESDD